MAENCRGILVEDQKQIIMIIVVPGPLWQVDIQSLGEHWAGISLAAYYVQRGM